MKPYNYEPTRNKKNGPYRESSSKGWGARRNNNKRWFFMGGSVLIVLCALLSYTGYLPTEGAASALKSAGNSIVQEYRTLVADARVTLGLGNDVDISIPVTSGVVVESYGVVLSDSGEENYHNGVDIEVPKGSSVLSAADGKVTAVDNNEDGTYWVTVKHDSDWSTVYGRLGSVSVEVGDEILQGDIIGEPKSNILHFEVLEKENQHDPVEYF